MALLKAPYDTESDKKKQMDRLKRQLTYVDSFKSTIKIPKKLHLKIRGKMIKEGRRYFQRLMVELLEEYVNKE